MSLISGLWGHSAGGLRYCFNCTEIEFLDINLTKDYSIHSKSIHEKNFLEWKNEGRKPDISSSPRRLEFMPRNVDKICPSRIPSLDMHGDMCQQNSKFRKKRAMVMKKHCDTMKKVFYLQRLMCTSSQLCKNLCRLETEERIPDGRSKQSRMWMCVLPFL